MEEDNLYQADGEFFQPFREPLDQALERKRERAEVLKSKDELRAMIKRLQERIDYYEANTSIDDDVRLDPQKFLVMHNSYTLTAKTLRAEKQWLEGLIEANMRRT